MSNMEQKRRGRKPIMTKEFEINVLRDMHEGKSVDISPYLMQKIAERGFVQKVVDENGPKHPGRASKKWVLTGKGRGRVALAKGWFKPKAPEKHEDEPVEVSAETTTEEVNVEVAA